MPQRLLLQQRPARQRIAAAHRAPIRRAARQLEGARQLFRGPGAPAGEIQRLDFVERLAGGFVIEGIAADQALAEHMFLEESRDRSNRTHASPLMSATGAMRW